MKTIKEKSEDYVSGFHPSIQRMCKESFAEGANYVLEQTLDRLSKCTTTNEFYEAFIDCVEQLKK